MDTFFLACFIFGALFTLASVALGMAGHGAAHLSHGAAHLSHGAADLSHSPAHAGHLPHAPHAADVAHGAAAHTQHQLPLLNASSVVGALTWFGATGYLLLRLGSLALPVIVLAALLVAALGWYLVARFLGLVLSGERELDPDDFRLVGTIGNLSISIPAGGTGEVMFSKAGARHSEAARAVNGVAIPRGTEVVITSYIDGFATVQPWGEFLADDLKMAAQNREA